MRRSNQRDIEVLYGQHGSALMLFAVSITNDRAIAQDVVHQVFLRLLEEDRLCGVNDTKAYLFACIRNAALNHMAAGQRNVALNEEETWFDPPERDYVAELNLRRALSLLPDDQREVTVLHVWGGLAFAEIGEILGINANTAASRYRYALARLRETMCTKENSSATF